MHSASVQGASRHAPAVQTGLDVLHREGFARLDGLRLGVLTHPAAVAGDLRHILDLLLSAEMDLRVLFGPEHGVDGFAQDMEAVGQPGTGPGGVLCYSLYGEDEASLHPPSEALSDIDLLLVDLQDVGVRYYTYAVTMRYCMEACAKEGVPVTVLDRPNPLGGELVEGPLLEDGLRSFVGGFRAPVRHGLTIGELAKLAVHEGVDVDLEVVPMQGWKRAMWFDQTGLFWVPPSPNMPTLDTATVYPGTCLVEATDLSEGRGTTRPFELVGAPWLDGKRLAADLNQMRLPGVRFRPAVFSPAFQKHAGQLCRGVQLHVTDRYRFKPFLTGLALLQRARRQNPERFVWRKEPYEFVADRPAIDLLGGVVTIRRAIEGDGTLHLPSYEISPNAAAFCADRESIVLYQA